MPVESEFASSNFNSAVGSIPAHNDSPVFGGRLGPDYVALQAANISDLTPTQRIEQKPRSFYPEIRDDRFAPAPLHFETDLQAAQRNHNSQKATEFDVTRALPSEGKSIGDLHKARIQDNIFEIPMSNSVGNALLSPSSHAQASGIGIEPSRAVADTDSSRNRLQVGPVTGLLPTAAQSWDARTRASLRPPSDSASRVQDLLVQLSQLQAENEQAKFLNAELTRSKMLLVAEVEMLRQDQVRIKNEAMSRSQDNHSELNSLMQERQSLIRQISGLQTELRQREVVLDAVTEQRKQQNAALESQEMMVRRMQDEISYLQEQVQLRTEETRKLRDQIARERFKADEDVSRVTSEVSNHLSQIASSRDVAHETARDLSKQLKELEKEFEQYRNNASSELERLRAETARLALLASSNSNAAQENDALRAELREAARNKADLTSRMQVLSNIAQLRSTTFSSHYSGPSLLFILFF